MKTFLLNKIRYAPKLRRALNRYTRTKKCCYEYALHRYTPSLTNTNQHKTAMYNITMDNTRWTAESDTIFKIITNFRLYELKNTAYIITLISNDVYHFSH